MSSLDIPIEERLDSTYVPCSKASTMVCHTNIGQSKGGLGPQFQRWVYETALDAIPLAEKLEKTKRE
jgi:hypothetical protein